MSERNEKKSKNDRDLKVFETEHPSQQQVYAAMESASWKSRLESDLSAENALRSDDTSS